MGEFVIQSHAWDNANDAGTVVYLGSGSAYQNRAWSFVPGVDGAKLGKIKFFMLEKGTAVGDIYVDIFDLYLEDQDASVKPGSVLATKQFTDSLTSSFAEYEIDFSSEDITLQAMKSYWVCFRVTAYGSTSNCYQLKKGSAESASAATGQQGTGITRSFAGCYSADQSSWANSATDSCITMQIMGTHDDIKDLWSNNSRELDKANYIEYGRNDTDHMAGWKITTPDDGKYREIENVAAGIRVFDGVNEAYVNTISIHEDLLSDSTSNPGDMVPYGLCTVSREAHVDYSADYLPMTTMYRWGSSGRPVLSPNTTYWFMFSPGYQATNDYVTLPTDSTNGGDGELYTFDRLGEQTKVDNWGLFYVQGKELDSDPSADSEYTYPRVLYTTTGPPAYPATQLIGSSANFSNIGYAFKPDIDCTLSKLKFTMKRRGTPESCPLSLAIYGSTGDNLDNTPLYDFGIIADTTSSDETYTPPWLMTRTLDLENAIDLTAGEKYWFVFSCPIGNSSHCWMLHESSLIGTNYIGTPYTNSSKSGFYDNDSDLSSPTYGSDAFPCEIIGRVSNDIETLVNDVVLGSWWGTMSTLAERFFYDATERYFVQKFKTPVRDNPIEVNTIGMGMRLGDPYVSGTSVWAEIREVTGETSIGDIVDNGTSDTISDKHPADNASYYQALTQFSWSTSPELQPDTEYWIVIKSDFTSTSDFWFALCTYDSLLRFKGISQGAYIADSTLTSLVAAGASPVNVWNFQINGVETTPIVPPPQDWIIVNSFMELQHKDTILRWPLTNAVDPNDVTFLWNVMTSVDDDTTLLWTLALSTDTTLLWNLETEPDASFVLPWSLNDQVTEETILPWSIELSTDTILPWHVMSVAQKDWVLKNIILNVNLSTDVRLLWAMLLQSETTIKWDLWEFKDSDTILNWPLTTPFHEDFTLKWGIFVTLESTLIWSLTFPVNDIDILRIPLGLSTDTVLPIGLMGRFSGDLVLPWNIENKLYEDFIVKNNLFMSSDTTIKYSLNDITSKVWTIINEISAKVYRDTGISYAIKIESDCILLIPIRGPVTRDFIIRHGLLGEIEKTHVIKFDLLNYNPVEAETILRNALLGKPRFYKIIFS